MNDTKDQESSLDDVKNDVNPKQRPKINQKSRMFLTIISNVSERRKTKEIDKDTAELPENFTNIKRVVSFNGEVNAPLERNHCQAEHKPEANSRKANDKKLELNPPSFTKPRNDNRSVGQYADRNSKFNQQCNKNSFARYDKPFNGNRKFPDRGFPPRRDYNCRDNAKYASANQFIKSRELSRSDESLNLSPQERNSTSKHVGKINGVFVKANEFHGRSQKGYNNEPKQFYPYNSNSKFHEKRNFNAIAKERPSHSFESGRSPFYSRSTSCNENNSSHKTDNVNEMRKKHSDSGFSKAHKVSDVTNINEGILRSERDMPSSGTRVLSDCPNDEKAVNVNNSEWDECDDGNATVSDEPIDSAYMPLKQMLSFDLNCHIPVDSFLTIVKDDDASSVSSENLEPMENYDLPPSEENPPKSVDSESLDEALDAETMKAIANYLEKLEKEESQDLAVSRKVMKDVNGVFNYHCKGNQVSLYGSYSSGLAVGLSNINLVLKSDQPERNTVLLMLQRKLSQSLSNYDVEAFDAEKSVRQSKICFYTSESILCQIMYDMKPVSDYCKTTLLLKRVCEYDGRVKTLIIAARKWAEACFLHEMETNKLHPVGLALLVIYFLQHTKPAVLPVIDTSAEDLGLKQLNLKNDLGIGELWFGFLNYYTKTFDWAVEVVTIQHQNQLLKSDVNWDYYSVAIQEPYSRKNISESLNSSDYIHSCFKAYYENLVVGVNSSDSETDEKGYENSGKGKYSFYNTQIKCPLPKFCEECAELEDELCEKCQRNENNVSKVLEKLPELTDYSMKCIDKALLNVYNSACLSDDNIKGRKSFVKDLENYIQKLYPDAKLELFGSSVNMFGLKKSDLDICMTFDKKTKDTMMVERDHYLNISNADFIVGSLFEKHLHNSENQCDIEPELAQLRDIYPIAILNRICSHLRKNSLYTGVFGLYSAKVPIVKFYSNVGRFLCDLSLYNVLSVHNSRLLRKYAMIDERCRIIGCALKYLTMKGCISDSSSKCLSSYSYILMVIHYLQQTSPPVLPVLDIENKKVFINNIDIPVDVTTNKNFWYNETPEELRKRYNLLPRNEESTAELWLGFLEYYLKLDQSFAVTITQKEPMLASQLFKHARLFNIEDPFEGKRNLGGVLSEENADKTQRVFLKARSLFGRNVSSEVCENVQNHYFSLANLLGHLGKEMECDYCGAFDHEGEDCLKYDPFKKSRERNKWPATKAPIKRKFYRKPL